jgi:hypothetical protein
MSRKAQLSRHKTSAAGRWGKPKRAEIQTAGGLSATQNQALMPTNEHIYCSQRNIATIRWSNSSQRIGALIGYQGYFDPGNLLLKKIIFSRPKARNAT